MVRREARSPGDSERHVRSYTCILSHPESAGKGRSQEQLCYTGPNRATGCGLDCQAQEQQPGNLSAGDRDQEVVSHSSQEGVRNKGGFSVLPPETLIWVYSLVGSLVRV